MKARALKPELPSDRGIWNPRWTRAEIDDIVADCDAGIRDYVRILMLNDVETHQSCEGACTWDDAKGLVPTGRRHCYPEPTVDFSGTLSAGWKALAVCYDHGLPVASLQRVWPVKDFEPTGPLWRLIFTRPCNVVTLAPPTYFGSAQVAK